jgi:hypothetical protein
VEPSRKQRKGETKKQMEEIHSERSWKKLERYLAASRDKQKKFVDNVCS